ncbi:MAG: prolyl oligopeptidase family serine peptidase [Arthrobacter sp.]|uniref:prolyl oligopeptidase family serine peptidase n=1 Tax=Arthrobacter sp. 179 TaxID=3457734 RepID=UPI002652F037|nr:prolyl oligopeptidase family serine peptidase [Micrococcaceae bacterium]MDN5879044.1 prolyl oligopeptidase family serine peptidase [Micrococcaceae bacterium]MDN5886411.1 prolyl oligopeptidase family serine peptidase [Micrococcaceae bacterium]MDN5904509.1 prolyl oligopeptidase family serine peptidase [Micrococcaceae bacterium]MDN6168518.1 prolyl oligopeptidase family serine peptidase [Micrococcaceae bacterium]
MSIRASYGSWPSPLTAASLIATRRPVGFPRFVADVVWWVEGRPEEGGRNTIMADGDPQVELLPAPYNVRSRVHEYGGAAWAPLADSAQTGRFVFTNFADQRVHLRGPAGISALTPDSRPGGQTDPQLRFAEFVPSADAGEMLAVCEDLSGPAPERYIVAIPLDGSAAQDASRLRRVTPPSRFVAYPRLSPDARRIAWISWEHPQMPWDGTVLHVGELDDAGIVSSVTELAGSVAESVLQPEWLDAGALAFISDRSGWWNLYRQDVDAGTARALCPREEEFAEPLWQIGSTWYSVLEDGRILAAHGTHGMRLGVLDPRTGTLEDLEAVLTHALPIEIHDEGTGPQVLTVSQNSTEGNGIRVLDLASCQMRTIRRSLAELPDPGVLPTGRAMEFTDETGTVVHANVYEPALAGYLGGTDEKPPFIAMVHGGPTGQAHIGLSLEIAYYTSRGLGVVDVNYAGSSGFGRAYRERLAGQWGVADVQDTVAVMRGLVDAGLADPDRLAIEGGSAGGWTTLACLTNTTAFSAGISRYGVADLEALVADTHDFEAHYMESLVGPWPQARALYVERAPINHVDDLDCPVLLLQGDEDKVVPPNQSQKFADALAAKGIEHAYVLFAGEQHGFRQAANIVRAQELSLAFYAHVFGFDAGVAPIELTGGSTGAA